MFRVLPGGVDGPFGADLILIAEGFGDCSGKLEVEPEGDVRL